MPDHRGTTPTPTTAAEAAPADLRSLVGLRRFLLQAGAAVASGLLLSAAFAPLEWSWCAWIALVPILVVPVPNRARARFGIGFVLGAAHFFTSLQWLTHATVAGWLLLAPACALFPAVWYLLFAPGLRRALPWPRAELGRDTRAATTTPPGFMAPVTATLVSAAGWVALEWLRSHALTGFPWNLVGVSQWPLRSLLPLTAWTGVHGISFLVLAVNTALALAARRGGRTQQTRGRPAELVLACELRIAGVQGCIEQCREYTEEEFYHALDVYTELTRQAWTGTAPDLIVWPETAVPAPVYYGPYARALRELFREVRTPMLIGAIDSRPEPGAPADAPYALFNSALLHDADGSLTQRYDKVHIVPFGEFVPFERYWPRLTEWIGMGRSLTAGAAYTVLDLPGDVGAGVNICYEDVFPGISRRFTLNGADLLVTLANDAWYAESSGSRQHLVHAVFRAAENRRPLFRSGNNSDTCLIWPDGRVTGLLRDPVTGNPFVRGTRTYTVPVWDRLPVTFYTRYGDVFAVACSLTVLGLLARSLARELTRRRRLRHLLNPAPPANAS
jgi:apolipoprotein N-acyltransferase